MNKEIIISKIVVPIVTLVCGIVLYTIIKHILNRAFKLGAKKFKDNKYNTVQALVNIIVKYFILIVVCVIILGIYGIDTKSIVTSLGIAGAALALAMQDLIKDFVSGISIVLENTFAIGDLVKIGDFTGIVTSFTLKTTRIKAWTGEEKIISNHFITEIINYTHNNNLAYVDVSLPYEQKVDELEEILTKICGNIKKISEDIIGEVKVLGLEDLASSSLIYRVVAEVNSGSQFAVQRLMRKEIKKGLDNEGISIPYNQLVIHNG